MCLNLLQEWPLLLLLQMLHDILSPEVQLKLCRYFQNATRKRSRRHLSNEILTDIEIHKQDLLPSFIDLPNLSSSIYSTELHNRLREFLIACPPSGPSPPVSELVIATADFQRDLSLWDISYVKGGVDAKELFHLDPCVTRIMQARQQGEVFDDSIHR